MFQNPALESKAILHIQPGRACQEAEIAVVFQQSRCGGPEIAVKVASARKTQARPAHSRKLAIPFLVGSLDLLLTDIRRIADKGIEGWQRYFLLTAGIVRDAAERLRRGIVKEIPPDDARVVRLILDLAGSQVQRGEMCGIRSDVAAEQLAD